jgi:hypothetical protein
MLVDRLVRFGTQEVRDRASGHTPTAGRSAPVDTRKHGNWTCVTLHAVPARVKSARNRTFSTRGARAGRLDNLLVGPAIRAAVSSSVDRPSILPGS